VSLRSRIKALEADLAYARAQRALEPRWKDELQHALQQQRSISHEKPLPRYGIDYSFGRPTTNAMRAQGVSFACRYLTGQGKALEPDEARALTNADIDIVSIYEQSAMGMLDGATQGKLDGERALEAGRQIGMPPHRPIYFACDFPATGEQIITCLRYLDAARTALEGRYYAGVYGGIEIIKAALDSGHAYAWQTLAWSAGKWDPRAQIRQTEVGKPVLYGVECDTDYAYANDFGQWKL